MARWQQIEALFEQALERADAERDAFLRDACLDDPELYRDVVSLTDHNTDVPGDDSWAALAAAQLVVGSVALDPGERLGPYEITSFIAAGGMGVVYRARDPRMGREVAIKVCPEGFNDRFSEEVRAAAALNHPNVCHVYDVGSNYLVMELVQGETLDDRIRDGRVSQAEALPLAKQIAHALEVAHERGVIHCDLKPGNIKITPDGIVKVLDFGLARRTQLDAAARVARSSGLAGLFGTTAYMSPEQVAGSPIDARSDIFAFGVVFYEMLSGASAFSGETVFSTSQAILSEEPKPLTAPASLAQIVHRCLRKEPAERYQTMREVRAALEKAILVADAAPSVAVLPFLNIGGGPDDEYFSDGLSEEIINALSRVPELNVTARTSSFMFPRTQADIRGIGESLGVGAVLEGSVRRAGNRVRVGARLISSNTGVHLWAGKYDRDLSDVFAVQDEIATALAEALRVELAPGHKHVARHRPALPAYEAYLRGRHFLHKGTPAALARTKECFEEAIAFDASYADPHFELGTYYAFMAMAGLRPGRELAPLIRAQAETALRLDASLLSAHALLGFVAATHDYDWAEAERQFRLATAAERVSPEARYWYALLYLVPLGHGLAAVRQMEVAVEHDPLNVFLRTGLAGACNLARRFDRTLQELRKVLEIDDAHWMPNFGEGAVYVATGRYEDAVRAFERGHQVAGRNAQIIGHLAGTLAVLGNRDRAAGLIGQLLEGPSHLAPIGMAAYHAICHEVDEAAAWFEKAIEFRDPVAVIYTRHPPCDAMRRSGKWPTLARMMNLPAENEERQRQSRAGE